MMNDPRINVTNNQSRERQQCCVSGYNNEIAHDVADLEGASCRVSFSRPVPTEVCVANGVTLP